MCLASCLTRRDATSATTPAITVPPKEDRRFLYPSTPSGHPGQQGWRRLSSPRTSPDGRSIRVKGSRCSRFPRCVDALSRPRSGMTPRTRLTPTRDGWCWRFAEPSKPIRRAEAIVRKSCRRHHPEQIATSMLSATLAIRTPVGQRRHPPGIPAKSWTKICFNACLCVFQPSSCDL